MSRLFVAEDDDEGAPDASFFEDDGDQAAPAAPADPLSTEGDGWPIADEDEDDDDEGIIEVPAEPAPAQAEGDEAPPTEEEKEPAPQPDLLAGRYQTPEALADGYRNLQGEFTRQQQERISERQQYEARFQEQDQLIQGMFGLLSHSMRESDPEMAAQIDQFQAQMQQQAQMQDQARQIAEQEVAPLRQTIVEQQVKQQAQAAVQEFYSRHQDLVPRSPEDQQVAMTLSGLMQRGVPADVTNVEHLEAAYEATKDPEFGMQLMMNPQAFQVPGAIYRAIQTRKSQAPPVPATEQPTAPDAAVAPARQPVRRRIESQVETGSGTPVPAAPGMKPEDGFGNDEFAEAARAYLKQPSKSVIFGGRR